MIVVAQSILRCLVVSFSGIKSLPVHTSNHCAAKRFSFFVVSIVYPSLLLCLANTATNGPCMQGPCVGHYARFTVYSQSSMETKSNLIGSRRPLFAKCCSILLSKARLTSLAFTASIWPLPDSVPHGVL